MADSEAGRAESLDDELRRISKTMALQPLEDPDGPSFYGILNKISSLAGAGGVADAQSMSDEETERAMAKQLAELKDLRPVNIELLLGFFEDVPVRSKGKLRQVSAQSEVQRPGDFYATIDEKSDESILKKVSRPKVLLEYPKYEMQHIRDALRFKCIVSTVVDAFRLLALLVDETQWAERGVHAVKVDLKKILKPKKFGWRFIGCDLKMPNGLIVECYIAFAELMAVDRANHIFFEKWRGKDIKKLSAEERRQYEADAKESTKRYNQAFCETLKRTTQNDFTALFAKLSSATQEKAVEVFNDILTNFDPSRAAVENKDQIELEALRRAAYTSEITGIPNGRQYKADMVELKSEGNALRCVFSLDMANLKILNEEKLGGVGHQAADKVLEYFGRELELVVNNAVSEANPVVLHNSYHMHGDEFCALVASTMPDAGAFQAAMKKLAERIAAIRFDSANEKCASYVLEGKAYPETYFRVGALCKSDADYNNADKLQELVGVEMKADYPDRAKVVPLDGRTNFKFSISGLSKEEKAKLEAVSHSQSEAGADVSQEEKALAEEMLAFFDKAQSVKLAEGRKYIKTDNLDEAQAHFEGMLEQPKSLSPEELKTAKQLLAFTLAKKGINRLQSKKFDEAASHFQKVVNDERLCDTISNKRLRKFRLYHVCALYEAGKQLREDGEWGEAKKRFQAAKKTKALPDELQNKNAAYLKECEQMCEDMDDKYDDLDESDEDDVVDEADSDEAKAFEIYKQGKRSMEIGMANQARQQFEKAKEIGLPKALKKRAKKFLRALKEFEGQEATQCVFSDNCTHILGSSTTTIGLSTTTVGLATTTVGLSTKTVSASSETANRELVMVLDEKFPENLTERASLIFKLKTDVQKAMKLISDTTDIDVIDLDKGSVIPLFRFVGDETAALEEEYLRQIDDKESPIYKGEVTCKINQERTNKMTMQLNSFRGKMQACPYQVGGTITLAQIQDEKIECKVDAKLGEGATATVFKVTTSGKTRALKVFKAQNSLEDLCTEASLMLTSNFPQSHPNVMRVSFVWYEQSLNEMFFLMGLADGGDLQEWMDDERLYAGTAEEKQERLILTAHQLACGLQHLHQRGILHEDFKPDNVLMTKKGVPVIGDLGVGNEGTIEDGKVQAMLRGGTPVYASPNVRKLFFHPRRRASRPRGRPASMPSRAPPRHHHQDSCS